LLVASSWFLYGIIFDPEDGGDTFLRKVSWLSVYYMTLHPRRYLFKITLRISNLKNIALNLSEVMWDLWSLVAKNNKGMAFGIY
jgi:hypothetical protein